MAAASSGCLGLPSQKRVASSMTSASVRWCVGPVPMASAHVVNQGAQIGALWILFAGYFHRFDGVGLTEPDQRRAHKVTPAFKRGQRVQWLRRRWPAGDDVGTGDRQSGCDVVAPVGQHGRHGVGLEFPQLRPLLLGIEFGNDGAADHVASDNDVVAIGEARQAARLDVDLFAFAENADFDYRPLNHLTKRVAAKHAVDVVDRDQRLAGDQAGAKPLFGFLFAFAEGRHRHWLADSNRCGDVAEIAFAATRCRRPKDMQWPHRERRAHDGRDQCRQCHRFCACRL